MAFCFVSIGDTRFFWNIQYKNNPTPAIDMSLETFTNHTRTKHFTKHGSLPEAYYVRNALFQVKIIVFTFSLTKKKNVLTLD